VDSLTPLPHYHWGNCSWYPLYRRLGGPQSRSGRYGEEKNLLPLPRIETRLLGRLGAIPTELHISISKYYQWSQNKQDKPKQNTTLFRDLLYNTRMQRVDARQFFAAVTPNCATSELTSHCYVTFYVHYIIYYVKYRGSNKFNKQQNKPVEWPNKLNKISLLLLHFVITKLV
jgi:hypothetical protein